MLTVWLRQEGLTPLRGTRARPKWDPKRASEPGRVGPFSRLRVASIVVGPSGPCLRLGAAHVFGRSGIPTVSAFGPHQLLCAASVLGPSRIPSLSARQNFERVCGLSRVKPEQGVFKQDDGLVFSRG